MFLPKALTVCLAVCRVVSAPWPQPTLLKTGQDALWIDQDITIRFQCQDTLMFELGGWKSVVEYVKIPDILQQVMVYAWEWMTSNVGSTCKSDVCDGSVAEISELLVVKCAMRNLRSSILNTKFVPWKFHKRRSHFEPLHGKFLRSLLIVQSRCPADKLWKFSTEFFDGNESYFLDIQNQTAIINTDSTIATLRAIETFKSLVYYHSKNLQTYIPNIPILIQDHPKWRHRGLSLDIARSVITPVDVFRVIRGMASVKMNRLHLHATDSQSWPLMIPSLPELAQQGAYHPQLIWSAADLARVQRYGILHGVSVYVELDMPGHTASVAHAYPELITAYNELDWSTFALEPLSGQLKLNSSAVEAFVDAVLTDLLPRVRQYTKLYHAGGDELNLPSYLLDDTVGSRDPKVIQPLLQRFFDQMFSHLAEHDLHPVIWEEVVLDWNLTVPTVRSGSKFDTLVQVWRSQEHLKEVLQRGHRVLFGDSGAWYLDCGYGAFLSPYPAGKSPPGVPYNTSGGFPTRLKSPYLDYCSPFHNWRHMYTYNPLEGIPEELHDRIEGGEVLLWSEQTDSVDLDFKLWPRVASAAEVLWSGVRQDTMLEDAGRRLGEWRERGVLDLGISSSSVHMTWCLMEGGCNL